MGGGNIENGHFRQNLKLVSPKKFGILLLYVSFRGHKFNINDCFQYNFFFYINSEREQEGKIAHLTRLTLTNNLISYWAPHLLYKWLFQYLFKHIFKCSYANDYIKIVNIRTSVQMTIQMFMFKFFYSNVFIYANRMGFNPVIKLQKVLMKKNGSSFNYICLGEPMIRKKMRSNFDRDARYCPSGCDLISLPCLMSNL